MANVSQCLAHCLPTAACEMKCTNANWQAAMTVYRAGDLGLPRHQVKRSVLPWRQAREVGPRPARALFLAFHTFHSSHFSCAVLQHLHSLPAALAAMYGVSSPHS